MTFFGRSGRRRTAQDPGALRDDSSQARKLILVKKKLILIANCPSQITASKGMVLCVQAFCVRGNCN